MKTLLLTISLLLCGIKFANAQAQTAPTNTLLDQLNILCTLSPEQIAKIEPIVIGFLKRRDETYRKYKNNSAELNRQVKKNRWDYEVSLIGILTPEQMGLLKAFDQLNMPIMTGNCKPGYEPIFIARAR
jgi:hypothetical protein